MVPEDLFDIDEIETSELLYELGIRLDCDFPPLQTMEDIMKLQHFFKVFSKYTSVELETILNR